MSTSSPDRTSTPSNPPSSKTWNTPIPSAPLPHSAEFVVIGGGAVGCGVAHALARAGHNDVLVLEREEQVGLATTSQGAGLCGQVRDSVERTRLARHSVALFREMQTGAVKPDWNEVGSLRIALSEERAMEFQRLHMTATEAGLETELLTPGTAQQLWPMMDFSRVRAVLWCPSDGYMTPACVVQSYRFHAEGLGVRFATHTQVHGVLWESGRVSGVETNRGRVACRYLVNAAGAHAYHVAQLAGLELPIFPVRHEYFVSVPLPELSPRLPCFRIPEWTLYGRVRDGGLLLGGWEPQSLGMDPRSYPLEVRTPEVTPDEPVLEAFAKALGNLFPEATTLRREWVGRGWPTFTPDGRFLIGESSRVPGFVMACGCNAHGISGSGGIGQLLVESLFGADPSPYVRSLSPDRFNQDSGDWQQSQRAAQHVYETYYGV